MYVAHKLLAVLSLFSHPAVLLKSFLSSLCCHEWFRNCIEVMKSSPSDVAVLEKLSIVLQKLSKLWYDISSNVHG